ncbi:MAG: SIR2 family protein, partial [Caldilineaceae bacterium]|nr:SIR2 family protein [Caldilineaceae bacterium]
QRTRDVIQILKDHLEKNQPPHPFDNLLARLPVETFITTRYDDGLERAFSLAERKVQPIVTDFDTALARRDQPVLIKLYGDLRQPQSLTLSEDDLYDLPSAKREIRRQVENALRGTCLFLCFDFDSPDFLILWREVLRELGRFAPMAYAAPAAPLAAGDRELWAGRNITLLDAPALTVVQTLAERLQPVGKPLGVTAIVKPALPAAQSPFKRYRNFDLELASGEGVIEVRVLRSSEGEDEEAVVGLEGPPPRLDGVGALTGINEEIGYRLLPGRVGERWAAAQATAENAGEGVRLRLFTRDEEAAAIPWEAAKIGERRPALRLQTPMVRYVNAARRTDALLVAGPLRLLAVLAPSAEIGLASLESNRERAGLEDALAGLQATGRVQLHWLEGAAVSRDGLQDRLRRVQPHLLHFVGHGEYDETTRLGSLAFARERGGTVEKDWVNTEELSILLDGLNIRFGLFNACQSGRGAGGVAHALVRSSLPAALGMQADVPDSAAIAFASGFYRALADRWPVDAAVVEARKSVQNAVGLDAPWWALPVLYMRAEDGKLFG